MSTAVTGRPTVIGLLLGETRARVTAFVRTPIAAFFTLVFPLIVLLLVGTLVGNAVLESRSGVRVAQFFTPAIAAYAAATAAYTSLAIGLSIDRERGVLRRQRALPIPTAALLGGRVGAGIVSGTAAVLLMVFAGVVFLDVQVVWGKLPAAALTLVIGIACFAALGFAVSSIARTPAATQAITNGTLVPLAFVSDVFVVGDDLPEVLSLVGGIFPLKAFANAMAEAFNPFTAGAGFAWSHLALMVAWTVGGAVVATRRWTWETPARPAEPPACRKTGRPSSIPDTRRGQGRRPGRACRKRGRPSKLPDTRTWWRRGSSAARRWSAARWSTGSSPRSACRPRRSSPSPSPWSCCCCSTPCSATPSWTTGAAYRWPSTLRRRSASSAWRPSPSPSWPNGWPPNATVGSSSASGGHP